MISGKILRDAIISGANNINNQRSRVDELNVFPVPDGDTGTNMGMTVGAAIRELETLDDDCTVGEASKVAASAMLRGARGNSGVITSLLFRGFSKALEGKKEADAEDLVCALEKGVEAAYKAVMKPTEGTILTVARVASEDARASGIADVNELWSLVLASAQRALDDTPNLLPVLKKAGVVDAGGQGILIVFEGMGKVFAGEPMIAGSELTRNKAKLSTANAGKGVYTDDLMKVEDIKNGYCTQFLINKNEGASAAKIRAFAESNGDSVVCIEDDDVINLHVHTADPGKILTEAIKYGYLTNFKIENMHEQFLARQKQGKSLEKQAKAEQDQRDSVASEFIYAAVDPSRDYGFVAVAAGEGLKAVFTDLAVDAVVSGGQTMNPATEDILAAVQSVPAKTVFVLPNNKNIIMAAEQAEKLADRKVIVLPTRTIPMGITAMLNFDPTATAEANTIAMMKAADGVSTGLITYAARDSEYDGKRIKKGEIMALENGKIVSTSSDLTKATYRLARSMCKKDTSFVTIISGCDVSDEEAEKVTEIVKAKCPGHVEVSHIRGGQPVYYYMISVE
ncbi:MAG: DAK2 domain-containing protein [Candidatus Faecalibacterium intestinavium]|uniref:DAK2 domain-containing protein n=1 Tax=Candidatus Faecalibacterium intestinavium TaxID=2838580 RepID=A0A9E2KME7_9FIRM|nr:DAK2 domain-containing protein [Candidatus Faecalibacterium intestinavium]